MPGAVERIVRSGAAYQASAILSAALAFATYNAYTTAIGLPVLGQADLILAWLILFAIVARLGFGEALLRHWFTASDAERPRLQRTIQQWVFLASLAFAVIVWFVAPVVAPLLSLIDDVWVIRIAGLGLFFYCNLDIAQTLLRARDDRRTYLVASVSNVLLTVVMSVLLVVVFDQGVRGYLIGNYGATAVIVLWLWSRELPVLAGRVAAQPALVAPDKSLVVVSVPGEPTGGGATASAAAAGVGGPTVERGGSVGPDESAGRAAGHHVAEGPVSPAAAAQVNDPAAALAVGITVETIETKEQTRAASRGELRALLRFGLPTIPTDAAIFGFNLLDRTILLVVATDAALGVFSGASKIAAGVILIARAFQLAFPPLAYGIADAKQASAVYASALRGYAVVLGGTVAGVALCAPWTVDILIGVKSGEADLRPGVIEILPLLAAAWALWGVVPVMTTIAGRLGATQLAVPAALVGLATNVIALVLLVPPFGAHGAAAALVIAYIVLIGTLHLLTRRHFPVAFDVPRIGAALGLSAGACLVAGPLADAPELGWTAAAMRLVIFAVLVAGLWKLALKQEERTELAAVGGRVGRRLARR